MAVLEEVGAFIRPGVTTLEVDEFAAERMRNYKAKSAFFDTGACFCDRFVFRSTKKLCMGWAGRAEAGIRRHCEPGHWGDSYNGVHRGHGEDGGQLADVKCVRNG